jgi:hypothetical protein
MTGFHSKQDMAAGKLQDGKCKWCIDGCAACDASAQPAQEPVAWQCADCGGTQSLCPHEHKDVPLYTAPPQRQWIWLSDADIAEVVDTTCQYTGSYEEYLIKKAERKIRSMNNG